MFAAVWFFAIAVVHNLGLKAPGLFIYYNIPSDQCQGDIILFMLSWIEKRHALAGVS